MSYTESPTKLHVLRGVPPMPYRECPPQNLLHFDERRYIPGAGGSCIDFAGGSCVDFGGGPPLIYYKNLRISKIRKSEKGNEEEQGNEE